VSKRMKKADYQTYLQSEAWKIRRKWKLEQAGHRCQVCNGDGELHVHHRTYDRIGDERENDLTVLCANCHARFHDKVEAPSGGESVAHLVSSTLGKMDAVGLIPDELLDWVGRRLRVLPDVAGGKIKCRLAPGALMLRRADRHDIARRISMFLTYETGRQTEWIWESE
jgi:hypothetical protein